MKPLPFSAFLSVLALVPFSGCLTSRTHHARPSAQDPLMTIQSTPIDARNSHAEVPPSAVRGAMAPEPVYRMPKLRKIYLEPYVDENGVAYGPQVKYAIEDPGAWNMDALRNPSKAYIPPAMLDAMQAPASYVVANTGEEPEAQPHKSLRDLYDLDSIEVTGFVERGQEPLARQMAAKHQGPKVIPYFDEKLGWVLIPASALQPDFRG